MFVLRPKQTLLELKLIAFPRYPPVSHPKRAPRDWRDCQKKDGVGPPAGSFGRQRRDKGGPPRGQRLGRVLTKATCGWSGRPIKAMSGRCLSPTMAMFGGVSGSTKATGGWGGSPTKVMSVHGCSPTKMTYRHSASPTKTTCGHGAVLMKQYFIKRDRAPVTGVKRGVGWARGEQLRDAGSGRDKWESGSQCDSGLSRGHHSSFGRLRCRHSLARHRCDGICG
ncbi:hypothetical protein DFH09DRAFT_1109232 [Mycena vulgaris]|nr:hypothetical protein DFH09DRAFT_1109232 [Mycena vulgaris]